MNFPLISVIFAVIFILQLLASTTYASLPAERYWHSMLPNTPLPKYIQRLLHSGAKSLVPYGKRPDFDLLYLFPYFLGKPTAESLSKNSEISNTTIFFLYKDLHIHTKMWPRFYKSAPGSTFLPRQVADSISFSSRDIPQILNQLPKYTKPDVAATTTTASSNVELTETINASLRICESPRMKGEQRNCATSLESLVDFVTGQLVGKSDKIKILSTEVKKNTKKQEYTIFAMPELVSKNAVFSHTLPYPYAVFLSHHISNTSVYLIPLEGADGAKVKAVAICHLDTSAWPTGHISFQLLNVKPGIPVCHFPLSDEHTLVWVV